MYSIRLTRSLNQIIRRQSRVDTSQVNIYQRTQTNAASHKMDIPNTNLDEKAGSDLPSNSQKQILLHDSQDFGRLVLGRVSFRVFSDITTLLENIANDSDDRSPISNYSKIISMISKKDRWVTTWFVKAIMNLKNSPRTNPFPLWVHPPFSEEASLHQLCLVESLIKAKQFILGSKFQSLDHHQESSNESEVDYEYVNDLSSKLVDSMPLEASSELITILEEFAREELFESRLRQRLLSVFRSHIDHLHELTEFLDLTSAPSFLAKIETNKVRQGIFLTKFAKALDGMISQSHETLQESIQIDSNDEKEVTDPIDSNVSKDDKLRRLFTVRYCLKVQMRCPKFFSVHQKRQLTENSSNDIDPERREGFLRFSDSKRKIFVGNIPDNVTESDIIHALRHIGHIEPHAVWIFKQDETHQTAHSMALEYASKGKTTPSRTAAALLSEKDDKLVPDIEEFPLSNAPSAVESSSSASTSSSSSSLGGTTQSEDPAITIADDSEITSARNPIATFAAIDMSVRRNLAKKRVLKEEFTDTVGFVVFSSDEGFMKAQREDVRVFGISIKKSLCRLNRASHHKSLVVEMLRPLNTVQILNLLSSYLGPHLDYVGSHGLASNLPVFVNIDFDTHTDAWLAYDALQQGIDDGIPIKVSWIKNKWYRTVEEKDRLWKFRTPNLVGQADSQDKEFQASIGKLGPK